MSENQGVNETSTLMPTDERSEEILFTKWWSIFAPINGMCRLPTKILHPLLIILTIVINSTIYFPLKNIIESILLKNNYKEYMVMINIHALISTVIPIMVFDIIIWKSHTSKEYLNEYPAGFNVVLCNVYQNT